MNFLDNIFERLRRNPGRVVLQEARDGQIPATTAGEVLELVRRARSFIRAAGLKKGDRCALLAPNSVRWVALDLALMAEGVLVVPLYSRQAPKELAAMVRDSGASMVCCADAALRDALAKELAVLPPTPLLDEVFAESAEGISDAPELRADADPVTIIYTSGTSGDAKGVVLTVGNLNHMLKCTTQRLDVLTGQPRPAPERVFHYLPLSFAGSWISLLSGLSRNAVITLSTDLTKLADEMRLAAPEYFLNVPALLERVKKGIEEQIEKRGGLARALFTRGRAAWFWQQEGKAGSLDSLWLALARSIVFPAIRKKLSPNLRALICGSAPLALETQQFFFMLGLPVLQVYGLTETTAICTMDVPGRVEPGWVGPAIEGTEMKLGENDEILVRGPHIFPGYWNRPEETAKVLRDGWFHTGDQGEVNVRGNWRIRGRIKNLLILASGHNIAPEPLEDALAREIPGAQQVVLVGDQRSYLAALVTGAAVREQVETALARFNDGLPHYKRIHAFHICPEAFTIENGLLTANGKLKRDAIAARWRVEIEAMYERKVT
ncbi:MAG TPA: AMP-binding protein [Candidatus Xenobia bacterium]|nr:AMP-binding protein [Candidatus Xenobia bacterium]